MEIHRQSLCSIGGAKIANAELISVVCPREHGGFVHTQDYYEFMYVLSGAATHYINGSGQKIEAGDLAFVRPGDYHDIEATPEQHVQFYNIEVKAGVWRGYCEAIELDPDAPGAADPKSGSMVRVPDDQRPACIAVFQQSMHAMQAAPTVLDVYRFLSNVLYHLRQLEGRSGVSPRLQPAWLTEACHAMHDWQNLADGLTRFIELSGVSVQHLSRVLKATTGQSPTEYINALRLKRAATLLATTDLTICDIALDSGFGNLPYFYRIFQQHYGATPRGFRVRRRQFVEAETIGS